MKFDVQAVFKTPFIGSEWIRGIESRTPEHAVLLAHAEAARRRLPPSTFTPRLVGVQSYRTPYVDSGFGPNGSFDRMPSIPEVA